MLNVIIAVMWEHKIGFMVSTGRDQGRLPDNGPALLPILLLIREAVIWSRHGKVMRSTYREVRPLDA